MKFKTAEAESAYLEIVKETSSRVAQMYEQIQRLCSDERDSFLLSISIEEFRSGCLARAITVATSVDTAWSGLKGSLAITAMDAGK